MVWYTRNLDMQASLKTSIFEGRSHDAGDPEPQGGGDGEDVTYVKSGRQESPQICG